MKIYSDGKSRVLKGSFPNRFKLYNSGVDVPFIRTGKDSIRLSGELPVGYLDVEEIIREKVAKPSSLRTMNFVMVGKEDIDRLDVLNQKIAINQDKISEQIELLTEHEANLANLETKNEKEIEYTNAKLVEVAKAFGKEIQADRDSITRTAESITSSLEQTGDILASKIEAHEKAKNPHEITKATIGLERVDNTSDIDKPISNAVKKALEEKADKTEIENVNKKLNETVKKQETLDRNLNSLNLYGGVGGTGGGSGSVDSVNGKKGKVVLTPEDIGAATSEQGSLADTALQPNDDISKLTNDVGYITSSALSGYATQTWVGQQGYLTSTALSGYATEQWVGQQGYITGITSSMVTTALGYTPYNGSVMTGADGTNAGTSGLVPAPAATDNTKYLRGDGTWQTVSSGGSYSAGTGIDITNNTISVTSPTLVNTATSVYHALAIGNRGLSGGSSISIGDNEPYGSDTTSYASVIVGNSTISGGGNNVLIGYSAQITYNYEKAVCIGSGSKLQNTGEIAIGYDVLNTGLYSIGIGYEAKAQALNAIAIGRAAVARGNHSIQIGYGTNTEASTFCVGFNNTNYKLLDGTTGKIPDGRLPIATSVSSSSTNADVVGAKLFYDTCGDIETLINAL